MIDDRRPGIASQRAPGVLWQLQVTGELPERPLVGLREEWWHIVSDAHQRLDQRGWPLQHDAELARRACLRRADWDAPTRAALDRYLSAPNAPIDDPVEARVLVTIPVADEALRLAILNQMFQSLPTERRAELARLPGDPIAPPVRAALFAHLEAQDGWLSYYAYRQLAPPTTMQAADALRALLGSGHVDADTIYGWADELVASLGA